jgi:secondary thiamine-phosphate synthase enzyme
MTVLQVRTTRKREIIDLTQLCRKQLLNQKRGSGICHLFVLHTTAALTTADLDPGTDLDLLDAFDAVVPKLNYRHPHNPAHVTDHILSSMIGTSVSFPVKAGEPLLGEWQRVVLVELDGPRRRDVVIAVTPEE